tara:strand:+ start:120 stop:305 length:186 start_codon:yes stop_codon:yes gene_type:complete
MIFYEMVKRIVSFVLKDIYETLILGIDYICYILCFSVKALNSSSEYSIFTSTWNRELHRLL